MKREARSGAPGCGVGRVLKSHRRRNRSMPRKTLRDMTLPFHDTIPCMPLQKAGTFSYFPTATKGGYMATTTTRTRRTKATTTTTPVEDTIVEKDATAEELRGQIERCTQAMNGLNLRI